MLCLSYSEKRPGRGEFGGLLVDDPAFAVHLGDKDLVALRIKNADLFGLKIAILGDILNSRVARSNIFLHRALGNKVRVSGPPTLIPAGIESLGAEVVPVTSGDRTLRAAIDEALRDWVSDPEATYYLLGSAVGPHPYPYLCRELHSVIGKEARAQVIERAGGLPDVVVVGVADWPSWLRVTIRVDAERPACSCGGAVHRHGVREVVLVDLPVFGRLTRLVWRKQRWRCTGCGWRFCAARRRPGLPQSPATVFPNDDAT